VPLSDGAQAQTQLLGVRRRTWDQSRGIDVPSKAGAIAEIRMDAPRQRGKQVEVLQMVLFSRDSHHLCSCIYPGQIRDYDPASAVTTSWSQCAYRLGLG
jgi:hypothetical protein